MPDKDHKHDAQVLRRLGPREISINCSRVEISIINNEPVKKIDKTPVSINNKPAISGKGSRLPLVDSCSKLYSLKSSFVNLITLISLFTSFSFLFIF